MSSDKPSGGSRRPRSVAAGDPEEDRPSITNAPRSRVAKAKGGKFGKVTGEKVAVDANVRTAGAGIHDRRDRHLTQNVTVTLTAPSYPPLLTYPPVLRKSREKQRYEASSGSESESSEEQHHQDSHGILPGQIDDVAEVQSRCSSDCSKRQRQKTIHLMQRNEELQKRVDETTHLMQRNEELQKRVDEMVDQLLERNKEILDLEAVIDNQAEQIEEYEKVQHASKVIQEAMDKIREKSQKYIGMERELQKRDGMIKELRQETQNLRILFESSQMEKAKQVVSSLQSELTRTQERKKKASSNLAAAQQIAQIRKNSEEVVQDAISRSKKELERKQSLAADEKQIEMELVKADGDLKRCEAALTALTKQPTHHNNRSSFEHRVSHSQPPSDSGYGTISSVSAASPARSICSSFSNNDHTYNSRSRMFPTRREGIAVIPGRSSLEYENAVAGSSSGYSPPSRNLKPRAPTPPPAGEISEAGIDGERSRRSHHGRRC